MFCLIYTIHGLLREREYELYILVAAITVLLAYCILGYSVNAKKRTDVKLVSIASRVHVLERVPEFEYFENVLENVISTLLCISHNFWIYLQVLHNAEVEWGQCMDQHYEGGRA